MRGGICVFLLGICVGIFLSLVRFEFWGLPLENVEILRPLHPPSAGLLVHQTWKVPFGKLNAAEIERVNSWRETHPRHRYCYWEDSSLLAFAESEFPWYAPVWERLDPFIKKVDCVRYMWMYTLGGIYADFDTRAMQPLEFVMREANTAYVPCADFSLRWKPGEDMASPAILGSTSEKNPFWLLVLRYIAQVGHKGDVLAATGPVALADVIRAVGMCRDGGHSPPRVSLIREWSLGIGRKRRPVYANHENHTTWANGTSDASPFQTDAVLSYLDRLIDSELGHGYAAAFDKALRTKEVPTAALREGRSPLTS